MKFCINVIAYNEAENIVKMAESAKEYMDAGGKIYLFDTGSTDDTVNVAEKLGFHVTKSKVKFNKTLSKSILDKWRKTFKVTCTPVETPVTFFCFDAARNAASLIPKEDIMFFADGCDHFINLDFVTINKLIDEGYQHFITIQKYGGTKGAISRFYDRRLAEWSGYVHEHLITTEGKWYNIPEEVFCIEHKVIQKDRGDKYMAGLICTHLDIMLKFDVYTKLKIPISIARWHYYVARELWIREKYADARRIFQYRYNCLEYPEERAAAMCWAAKCKQKEGGTDDEVYEFYKKAYDLDTTLREACFEYCQYHFLKKNWKEVLEGANKCTKIINDTSLLFFEDSRFNEDHNLSWYLFHGNWNTGSIDLAIYHWRKFTESRGIIEEKHQYWKTYDLAKYKYFPKVPYEIKNFECSDEIYKCIGTIGNEVNTLNTNGNGDMLINFAKKFIPPCTSIIDATAGKGYFAISMSKLVYPAITHAFECIDYKELVTNSFLNSRENLKTHERYLSSTSGRTDISHICHEKLMLSRKGKNKCYSSDVKRMVNYAQLDDFFIGTKVDNTIPLTLIKINEGEHKLSNSLDIINGAINIIEYAKPTIIISYVSNDADTASNNECNRNGDALKKLKNIGYVNMKMKTMDLFIPPNIMNRKRVAIVCYSSSDMKWDGSHFEGKYIELGESEYAVVNLATALCRNNILVDVWCNVTKEYPYGENPRYINYRYFHGYFDSSQYYNAVIYWRYNYEIRTKHKCTKNILWIQEHSYPKVGQDEVKDKTKDDKVKRTLLPKEGSIYTTIDEIVVLSENHKQSFFNNYKSKMKEDEFTEKFKDKVHVIPNSINVSCRAGNIRDEWPGRLEPVGKRTNNASSRIRYRCVYLNNRSHGLDILLNDWYIIKEKFPTATLHIIYGPQTWGINTREQEKEMNERIKSMKDKDVYAQHSMMQHFLQSFLETCDYWLYPCIFEEVYNIQGVQAVTAGVIPIVSDQAFLRILAYPKWTIYPLDNGHFGKMCIEVMSLNDEDTKTMRETTTKLGQIAFCDLQRQASLFESIMY
jgi:glycosyltransferase involved in cell wall biosynthesis